MKTLVLVEHDGSAIKDATLAAVTAAAKLGEVHLLVAGKSVDAVAQAAAKVAAVGKVHVADGAHLEHQLAEDVAPVAARLMEGEQIRRLAVLNRDKRLAGIVSLGDLAVSCHDDLLSGRTLEAVSEPAEPRR